LAAASAYAQSDRPFVTGGQYDKPYLARAESIHIGGYAEVQYRFERENGVTDEATFVPKRFNLFTFSPVSERTRVATELEFEDGGEEIKIELATIDFALHPSATFRGGLILSPLGRFNLAHDSPANELTDRPLVAESLLGVALTEAGMGFYGSFYPSGAARITYEAYATNGFHDGILIGDSSGTRVPAGRGNFEDNNTKPSFVGRIGVSPTSTVEFGSSVHHGAYNAALVEGLAVDEGRRATVLAADADARFGRLEFLGEWARTHVDVPEGMAGVLADRQTGFYVQASVRFLAGVLDALPGSRFTGTVRYDQVDFDARRDGDDARRLTLGVNFRPTDETVFKLDYQRSRERDAFNNPSDGAAALFSVATYF